MMKLKLGKGNLENCTIELGNISELCPSDENMYVVIDIENMSNDLKVEIDRLIEIEKVNYICEMKKYYCEHPDYICRRSLKWCNEPAVIISIFVQVIYEVGKPTENKMVISFMDAKDEFMDSVVYIELDLCEYEEGIKEITKKELLKKFF